MIYCVFALILLGLLVGKIKFFGVRLGLSCVLILSLLFGVFTRESCAVSDIISNDVCSFLSSFGTALFISAIGLQSGTASFAAFGRKHVKAFACSLCIVIIGFFSTLSIGVLDKSMPLDILVGLFSGSMTSTPAMSVGIELYGTASQVSLGYGMSYVVGLLGIVLFVQSFRLPYITICEQNSLLDHTMPASKSKCGSTVLWVSVSILAGMSIAFLLPIGNTGGMLISSLFLGYLSRKRNVEFPDLLAIKTWGLLLFFIGAGICAGRSISDGIYWNGILYSVGIASMSLGGGYFISRYLFKFSKVETLSILCGGMTSTPAIGILQERDRDIDLHLYSVAYIGALIAMILFVRVFGLILT